MKIKLPIIDNLFSHCYTTSNCESDIIEWVRDNYDDYDFIFITDNSLPIVDSIVNKKKYGWLVESPEITKVYYDYIEKNYFKFDKIFTFKKEFLEKYENAFLLPIGGCWINNKDRGMYLEDKSKLLSIISSNKTQTNGHKLRHTIINLFNNIDVYGRGYNPIDNKIIACKDYMFQIVIENTKCDYYFTEKIIDCLQTGVIPIYYGCPSISNFFNINGILFFNTIDELYEIINSLSHELYKSKIEHIKDNFELSKKYLIAEEYLINEYIKP